MKRVSRVYVAEIGGVGPYDERSPIYTLSLLFLDDDADHNKDTWAFICLECVKTLLDLRGFAYFDSVKGHYDEIAFVCQRRCAVLWKGQGEGYRAQRVRQALRGKHGYRSDVLKNSLMGYRIP